jgi:hypothetical protein
MRHPTLSELISSFEEAGDEELVVHPSELLCARRVWYRINRPELTPSNETPDEVKGLGIVGTILHAVFVPLFAEVYRQQGYEVLTECHLVGEVGRLPVRGRADIIARDDNQIVVIDLKFLHPQKLHVPYRHHLMQVAMYAHLCGATRAALIYIARDLTGLVAHDIDEDGLARHIDDALEMLRQADVDSEGELPPPLPANDYPCVYRTFAGDAYCAYYNICHPAEAVTATEDEISSAVKSYIEAKVEYERALAELEGLKDKVEALEQFLKRTLVAGQLVRTEAGAVRLIEEERHRVDIPAVRRILKELRLQVPEVVSKVRRLEVLPKNL